MDIRKWSKMKRPLRESWGGSDYGTPEPESDYIKGYEIVWDDSGTIAKVYVRKGGKSVFRATTPSETQELLDGGVTMYDSDALVRYLRRNRIIK